MRALSSADGLELLLLLLLVWLVSCFALVKLTPTTDAFVARSLPVLVVLSLALALLHLLLLFPLLAALLLHLRLQLPPSALLIIHEHNLCLFAPLFGKVVCFEFLAVDRPLVVADQQHAGVGNSFVEPLAVLLVHEFGLGFFQPVKSFRGEYILALVGMDEKGLFAICNFDVGFWDAWLEIENSISAMLRFPVSKSRGSKK